MTSAVPTGKTAGLENRPFSLRLRTALIGVVQVLASSWRAWIPALIIVGIAVSVFFALGALGYYSLPFIESHLSSGEGPAETSLLLTTLSFAIGFAAAIPLALVRAYPPRLFRHGGQSASDALSPKVAERISGLDSGVTPALTGKAAARKVGRALLYPFYAFATGYVAAVRGTPFLVQLFVVYYALIFSYPRLLIFGQGDAFWAALIALTINTAGYQAEALRGGLQSVEPGQVEAARAMGLSSFRIFRSVVFPQSLRLVTLPLTNEWISNFKTSTICSYITVIELFYWARGEIGLIDARPVEAFVMLTIFYLLINVTLSRTITYIESKRRIPGLGTPVLATSRLSTLFYPGRP